ncbi:hypothetical protein KZ820_14275 [Sphingomonas sp. RRHST34]|uniref:Cytoplasmic protein n=1 Tax=Sphingomonas citri TaxID=2862499 RepID=A0ABS7BR71_9SPHN|nr:hypothetical protein [Sphingomonas citri]MBW6531904.1 hypothetical protein [Sphingomonas citri]
MPTQDGTLSVEEISEIARIINERVPDPNDPCPNCHQLASVVMPYLGRVDLGWVDGMMRGFSTAITICNHCGFVRHFSTAHLGVEGHPDLVPITYEPLETSGLEAKNG